MTDVRSAQVAGTVKCVEYRPGLWSLTCESRCVPWGMAFSFSKMKEPNLKISKVPSISQAWRGSS